MKVWRLSSGFRKIKNLDKNNFMEYTYIQQVQETKTMKVFSIKAYGYHSGGMAIVAAESEEEAIDLACLETSNDYNINYHNSPKVVVLSLKFTGKQSCVLEIFETGE